MPQETLKQALLNQLETFSAHLVLECTAETPLPTSILCANIQRQETHSELLAWIHDHVRTLITHLSVETLTDLLLTHCNPLQLQRSGLWINPSQPVHAHPDPVVLITSNSQLRHTPQSTKHYASPSALVELYQCAGEIGGYTQAQCVDCNQIKAKDFARLKLRGRTTAEATDYTVIEARDSSRLLAGGYAEVSKYDEAQVTSTGSARIFDHGHQQVQAMCPITYLKRVQEQVQVLTATREQQAPTVLRLATAHEQRSFCRRVGIHPHMLSHFRSAADQDKQPLDELKQWLCEAAEKTAPKLVRLFKGASTTTELLDRLVPHLPDLLSTMNTYHLAYSFNHEQLAERQIFVNDLITPQQPLKGTFYVFGNQAIDQPLGTTGYYFNYSVAHVQGGKAILHGQSLCIGERAEVHGYDESLCYVIDGQVRLHDRAVGSLHGKSQGYGEGHARLYGYDQTQLTGYGQSSLLPFDEATCEGIGATAYAESTQLKAGHQLNWVTDPNQLAWVRLNGLPEEISLSRLNTR